MLRRPLKRILVFATEAGLLGLGFFLTIAAAVISGGVLGSTAAELALGAGFGLAFLVFKWFRRKHRSWKIEYDATGYQLEQLERKLHPTRAKYKRILYRAVVCAPGALAAFVLFFLPLASHLLYPRSQYLRYYRVPIPWTATVFSFPGGVAESDWIYAMVGGSPFGQIGGTTFWADNPRFSAMTFGNRTGTSDAVQTSDMVPKVQRMCSEKSLKDAGSPFFVGNTIPTGLAIHLSSPVQFGKSIVRLRRLPIGQISSVGSAVEKMRFRLSTKSFKE